MRKMVLGTIVCVAFALPGAAYAQATRTAEDYVCQLSGDCDQSQEDDISIEAPERKGFSIAGRTKAPEKAAPERKAFSLTKTAKPAQAAPTAPARQARPTPVATARREAPTRVATATKRAPAKIAKTVGRGDLSLSFKLGSAELTDEARANAREFAKALSMPALAGKKVLIEGHTDRQGSREFNLELSERRAQAVADYLKTLGVSADRLSVKGFGFDRPVSDSAERNRRVEAVLVS
jgi:OmpA-OmpF porin, OOP family